MEPQITISFDSLLPPEMAARAENIGLNKARLDLYKMFALAVLAGAFVSMGAVFSTAATAGLKDVPFGLVRLLSGLTFSIGLMLVVVAGAELFTGNNLIVMAWASGKVTTGQLLRNWLIVYTGNFVGALLTAGLMFLSGQHQAVGQGAIGLNALNIANAKVGLGFFSALLLGLFCNALVCLAVWLCMSARSTTDKLLSVLPPVTAFVAAGFEHSVANMYFIPLALFIKAGAAPGFWAQIGKTTADYGALTWERFLWGNLLPVTIGNIIGGALMVGLMYWFIYSRAARTADDELDD